MSIERKSPVPSDIEIAQAATIRPIVQVAENYGICDECIDHFGKYKAKVRLEFLKQNADAPKRAKYIDVTAISPTPLGEGKTTTTVGLTQGLGRIGKKAIAAIRQPSMGPTFGIKGGAAGGGYSQIVPMEDFNLHLTGDIHAVAAAHNLCATALDARMYHEGRWSDAFFAKQGMTKLDIDPYQVLWRRVVDMNDRPLRDIVLGIGGVDNGPLRQSGFDIAVASEVMAILALAKDLKDLRERMGRIVLAIDKKGKAVTTEDLGVAGAMTILLKDAIKPNILQTLEEQLAFVHAGPFANIAHGNSSVIADLIATKIGDYVVTESGFGADMGFEKFVDIKCRTSGIFPDAVVLVATVRALKMHGGGPKVSPGKPLGKAYVEEDIELVRKGLSNLIAHLGIVRKFGVPAVVAINAFPTDTEAEWNVIKDAALKAGAMDAVVTKNWAEGGDGAVELAEAVVKAANRPSNVEPFYPLELSIKEKIERIAREVYGAEHVAYSAEADKAIDKFGELGYGQLPICMAKTQYSLSHDPALKGAPKGFIFPINDVRIAAGAGFIYPLSGEINTMPGLSSKPGYMGMDIDVETGRIIGLS
ncbi:MAG: formate--tetrahydrofolate ligase [Spirochaetae bacterium HGW-Spirochaetae-3]|jgi:methylenetetrahydrofolate dehydrogenase (NADP+)/methenyltetrahydrofolate cyclohydrolase/formyltetrahydrofolate synthetase/formate--tetrahydrofolate ligase|nr:MAG: formate--tetrahydrofolate ligase [Spirochaetae bacterium HGW-Spirochaetae-3]